MSSNTIIIGTGRQTGKTTKAIKLARAFDCPIVTPTRNMASNIYAMAQKIEGRGIRAISVDELAEPRERSFQRIIVDDADIILEELLRHPIAAVTIDGTEWRCD